VLVPRRSRPEGGSQRPPRMEQRSHTVAHAMVVVDIDRGPTAELEVVFELKAVASGVLNPLNEDDPLPGTVLDCVRVAVGEDASGVRVSGLHSR
jgi:hypothetical protein